MIPVFTAEQLVAMIERSPKGTKLKLVRRGTSPRWVGLCPFHPDKNESFNVFVGKDGKPRWKCLGCQERGDARHWIELIEGKTLKEAGFEKPDPQVLKMRRAEMGRQRQREKFLQDYRNRHPDCCIPDYLLGEITP